MPLGADASKEDYIRDFLDSDAPQFKGKSKKKRVEMALAAFYGKNLAKAAPRPLFVARYVENAGEIIKWAKSQGFDTTVDPEELHVTIAYSRAPVDWMKADESFSYSSDDGIFKVAPGGPRVVERLGDKGAVVLLFKCRELGWRHDAIRNSTGASWDYQSYQPHVTITYNGAGVDLTKVEPYTGPIVFGPEIFAPLDNTYVDSHVEKMVYDCIHHQWGIVGKVGNPFHKPAGPGGGQFTSGAGSGAGKHVTSALAGGVTGAITHDPVSRTVDWFFDHKSKQNAEGNIEAANHETAKKIVKSLLGIGVDLALTTAYGKLIQATLPVIMGPGKDVAVAAATLMANRFGPELKAGLPTVRDTLVKAIQAAHAVGFGKAFPFKTNKDDEEQVEVDPKKTSDTGKKPFGDPEAEDTSGDDGGLFDELDRNVDPEMIEDQLQRLLTVLQEMDTDDNAVDKAKQLLEDEDPGLLETIMSQTDDKGPNDYHDLVQDAKTHPQVFRAPKGEEPAKDEAEPVDNKVEEDDEEIGSARVVKVDKSLGLVFGWAIVCKANGKDYYDLNIDHDGERVPEHIPESAMLKAASDFMEHHRVAKEMHGGDQQGTVVFAFPLTTEIAKALGIETKTTGLLIAMKPGPVMLAKFASGELKGFSIGGSRVKARELTEEAA